MLIDVEESHSLCNYFVAQRFISKVKSVVVIVGDVDGLIMAHYSQQ